MACKVKTATMDIKTASMDDKTMSMDDKTASMIDILFLFRNGGGRQGADGR